MADINFANETYKIATTHLPDTEDGLETEFQIRSINNLLQCLDQENPHLICGDFNIPRGYNSLYNNICNNYQDNIPTNYKSSLDRTLHHMGNKIIDQPIFDEYMVDYIFTKIPYETKDVRLEFGISDHAGVVASVYKNQ